MSQKTDSGTAGEIPLATSSTDAERPGAAELLQDWPPKASRSSHRSMLSTTRHEVLPLGIYSAASYAQERSVILVAKSSPHNVLCSNVAERHRKQCALH